MFLLQHFNAIKASYFSAFIYSLLLEKEESKHFEECFLNSFIFATSQSILLEDKECADKLVSYLQNIRVNSSHHAMQIRLLNARHQLHLGEVSNFWEYWYGSLTHFQPMFHFYTIWKHQKTSGFLIFSGGIEVEHWLKMG